MTKTQIKFGTDGWRGVIAEEFTFENVRRVAQATADYWNSHTRGANAAIVGYDTRFMSEVYAKLVCEVMAANGIKVLYPPQAVPTPAISYAVRDRNLCGAVMITASHNPPQFNGYKLKAEYAGSAEPEVCAAIESHVDRSPVRSLNFDDAVRDGRIKLADPRPAHLDAVKKIVDLKTIRAAGLPVVVDSMHGCGGTVIEDLLKSPRVRTIRSKRNPLFGGVNPEPIGKNLRALSDAVKHSRAQIGIATDGDADRMGVVDEQGRYVSIQLVFAMLLLHLLRNGGANSMRSRSRLQIAPTSANAPLVVKSSNSTYLVDRICRAHNLDLAEVPVGFKHICKKMRETDVLIGGEESGGIGFRGHIPERDGIMANLMLLELLAVTKKSVTQIITGIQKEFGRSAYDRIDIHYPLEKRDSLIDTLRQAPPRDLLGVPLAEMKDFDGVKYIAQDDSWLMFRVSGTEPIVRIYSEASSPTRVAKLLDYGKRLVMKYAE